VKIVDNHWLFVYTGLWII